MLLVRIALGSMIVAIIGFILLTGFHAFKLNLFLIPILYIATDLWLFGFGLLFVTGLWFGAKHILQTWRVYFSKHASLTRKLHRLAAKQKALSTLQLHKLSYLEYYHAIKRRQLQHATECEHIQELTESLTMTLSELKPKLSKAALKYYRRRIAHYKRHRHLENLLELQKHLSLLQ